MRLIRLFFEPRQVFSEMQDASWLPPFVVCVAMSLVANLVIVSAIGLDVIMRRVQTGAKLKTSGSALACLGIYTSGPVQMVIGLLAISLVMWVVLQMFHRSSIEGPGGRYAIVFTVCSYAAYAREAVRLIITVVVASWHHFSRIPLTRNIKTDATAFLNATSARPLFILARSLDVLMLGFLALVTVGLWKAIPNLRLQRAAAVVLVSWLIYVGLALGLGR